MVIGRRSILKWGSATLLFPWSTNAFPLTKILGHPGPQFTQSYIDRYLSWYEKKWSPLQPSMSAPEKELFLEWKKLCQHFGEKWQNDFFVENFLTRHHLVDDQKRHACLYTGLIDWPQASQPLIHNFIKTVVSSKDYQELQRYKFFGWSSNFDSGQTKLFFKNLSAGQLYTHSPASPLGFIEVKKRQINRRVSILPKKELPAEAHPPVDAMSVIEGFQLIDDKNKVSWKVRTRSTYLLPLKTGTMTVAGAHKKEFNQGPDFIDVSKTDEIKLYYP